MAYPKFRGANLEIQSYRGSEFILSGPAETGKTWATLWLLDSLLRATPKGKANLIRKVQSDIWGSVWVTYKASQERREALGEPAVTYYGGEKPEWVNYPNGAKLWIVGLDNASKVLSSERDFIYVNQAEELESTDWEFLTMRNTGRGCVTDTPMLFGDANPGPEDHWILKRAEIRLFHSLHKDNPSLYHEDGTLTEQGIKTMRRLESLTGVRKERYFYGKWVGAEGLFFEVFNDEDHVCEPFDIPLDAPIWGALDHGFKHNTAFGLYTEIDGVIYKIAEHARNKWLPPHHCKAIWELMDKLKLDHWRLYDIVAGHDVFAVKGDKDGKTISEQYLESVDPETEQPNGITLTMANIARHPGAMELLARFGNKEMGIEPTFKIWNTCPKTIATFKRMVHDSKAILDDVLKVDCDSEGNGGDDLYDETRYAVMSRQYAQGGYATAGERR